MTRIQGLPIQQTDKTALENIISDKDRLLTGSSITSSYFSDGFVKETDKIYAVALPKTKEEIIQLVKYAEKRKLPIITRGAGTGLSGATNPVKGELIIDMTLMNRILDFDKKH